MMVARVKTDARVVRSEPPTYVSINEDSEASDVDDSTVDQPMRTGKFVASQRSHDEAPTQKSHYSHDDTFSRTISAQSLPVGKHLTDVANMSIYDRTLHMLAVDPMYQKEVALGKRIGFYRLGKELGSGNFSKVKLGIHVLTKEKVAVKIMDRTKMDTKAQHLLEREIKAMERMHHPNIIRLFECVETLTRIHLVIEYAGGGELYIYVHEKGKLTESEAKPLFAQIVCAVSHMHSRGIIHRDIKAENVMFSAPGVVKLVDFGFSCMVPSTSEQLSTFCGSPPYAAPELFRDKSYNGALVDIWALGVLMHFMVVGVTPFRGESVQELKSAILLGNFTLPHYLDQSSKMLIECMLAMDPLKRPKIDDIKKSIWLKGVRFPNTYLKISTKVDKDDAERREMAKRIWRIMGSYGITEAMMEEVGERGPKNAIIGTYRIVQYQVQTESRQVKSDPALPGSSTEERKIVAKPIKNRSKTCSIL